MSSKSKWILPLSILAVSAVVIFLLKATQSTPPTVESKEKAWLVNIESVKISSNAPDLTLLGTVKSPYNTQLTSSIQADVFDVPVRNGSKVEKGQILISLDTSEIQSLVDQRRADLMEVSALIQSEYTRVKSDEKSLTEEQRLLQVAQEAFSRQEKLKSSNLIAQERLEQSESEVALRALSVTSREQSIADHPARLAQLQARKNRAQAQLADAERDLKRSEIKAPFTGIITGVSVSPGDRVQIGQNLVSMFDSQEIEVQAQLPDKFLSQIRAALSSGNTISAHSTYFGELLELNLSRLSGASNANTGAIDAFFVPSKPTDMILDSTLKLQAQLPEIANSVTLPPASIYGNKRVYKVVDSRLQAVRIKMLGSQVNRDGSSRAIISAEGFNEQDQIVTTQLPNAISGLKVEIRESQVGEGDLP